MLYRGLSSEYPSRALPPKPPGRWLKSDGYVTVRLVDDGPLMIEHRYVMELIIGRPLLRGENVHHVNGVRHDNRPENLELWSVTQPPGQRMNERIHCPGCQCGVS